MAAIVQNAEHVFINCPFDSDYKPLFDAMVFAVFDCGFVPRCSLEVEDAADVRIDKISRIIQECKFGIHDLSRIELNEHGFPRFNMPFELGLFLGAKRYGSGKQREKTCLIFEKEGFDYKEFISDIGGQDITPHKDERKYINPRPATR